MPSRYFLLFLTIAHLHLSKTAQILTSKSFYLVIRSKDILAIAYVLLPIYCDFQDDRTIRSHPVLSNHVLKIPVCKSLFYHKTGHAKTEIIHLLPIGAEIDRSHQTVLLDEYTLIGPRVIIID